MNKPLVEVFLISSLMFFTVLPNTPSSLTVRADSTYTQKTVPDFANATGSNITVLTVNGTPEVVLGRTEVDTWYRQPTPASPPARAYGGLATIFNSDELLLYGGWDGASDLDDTWLYNFTEGNWSQPDPPEKPSARDGFAMAPVFGTDEAVLFGGSDTPLNDTWIFNASLGLWFQQFPAECPPARTRSAMVPVWGDDKVVLFGGSAQGVLMNDTWVYDIGDNNWTVKAPAESPPARESPAMSMVPEDDKVVLFGGNDGWPYLNDTWVYDPGSDNWSLQNTTIAPAQTFGNVLCPLFGTGELMLYGGANLDNQTWLYDYSSAEWRSLLPPASPLGRHDYAMAPVFGTDQAILFSGADSYRQSTWMFNFSGYCGEGCFTSAPRDLGGPCSFSSLEWNATVSAGTGLRFQLRTADSLAALNASHFVGPGGDPNATYDVSGAALWPGLGGGQWFQYRALLTSTVPELSPVLREVSLDFDFAPDAPEPLSPGAGDWANGSASYSWLFRDNDSADQGGFELQAGPDASLSSVTYDSGNVGSGCQTHTATLPDGSFFWRVRTCDGGGTWGPFSQPRAVRIDGDAPEISVVTPPGGPLDRTDFTLYGTAYDALSGLASVEARTDGGDWLPANGTSNWHVDLALAKGPHEVDVRATDAAGNANITQLLYDVNRPPQVNLTSPLEGGVYNMTDRVNLTVDAFDLDGDLMTFIWKDGTVPLGTGLDMSQRFSEGNHTVSVTVSDGKGHEVVRSVNFTVYSALPIQKLGILSPFENQVLPSGAVSINFTVANFTISPSPGGPHIIYRLDDGPETGWYSSLNVTLSNVPNGDHVVRLWLVDASGRYLDNPESAASIDFSVNDPSQNLPDLTITPADISLQPKDPREGDMVSITFRVSNTGISDSRGFNVILYIDGNETAYSIFRALGAGANSTAKLTWNAVRGNHTLRLSVDPANFVPERTKTNNEADVPLAVGAPSGAMASGAFLTGQELLLALAVLACAAVGGYLALRSRRRTAGHSSAPGARSATAGAAAGGGRGAPLKPLEAPFAIEDTFLIYRDGRLIQHVTRRLTAGEDSSEIIASMLTAVQHFIQDALSRGQKAILGSMEYSGKKILLEGDRNMILALVISGPEPDGLRGEMVQALRNIEAEYSTIIPRWNGDVLAVAGTARFLTAVSNFRADDLSELDRRAETRLPTDVKVMSEVEFYQGFARLKVAVRNEGDMLVADAALDLHFNEDILRLERIEPAYPMSGKRVVVGNIGPREKKTVAYYLDPQICTESAVDGVLTYRNAKGEFRTVPLKRRMVTVVCPILHTEENINTAMLRRMIGDELDQRDSKLFVVPETLGIGEAFSLGKRSVEGHDVRFVREFIEKEPYKAEAWYYGKTKGREARLVIRVCARGEGRTLEFFVASISRLAVTGLLAELRSDLVKRQKESAPAFQRIEQLVNVSMKEKLDQEKPLLEKYMEDDGST